MAPVDIKVCGLSTADGIAAALGAGATHVGLVHFAPSPRHLALDAAAELRRIVAGRGKAVLLLADASPDEALRAIEAVRPDAVQLHGGETPEACAQVRERSGTAVWKALPVSSTADVARANDYRSAADFVLFDAKTPTGALPGGMGLRFDWSLLAGYRGPLPWGLAGGLTPANVAEAIRTTGAPLVDASSGVESAPGVKDVDKIAAFCKAARHV